MPERQHGEETKNAEKNQREKQVGAEMGFQKPKARSIPRRCLKNVCKVLMKHKYKRGDGCWRNGAWHQPEKSLELLKAIRSTDQREDQEEGPRRVEKLPNQLEVSWPGLKEETEGHPPSKRVSQVT
ncbi:hypothetical protein P7K49_012781 [Saguinus oedipus]|uniref:Uncharacterized protein n=1 Tax=Saguinus oedipus TaxID=9490 RepID=A0ABQ9VEM5_SAGOE|nr:hypothetical protein P7K49_012781 [Saguinus oedipus]